MSRERDGMPLEERGVGFKTERESEEKGRHEDLTIRGGGGGAGEKKKRERVGG